MGFLRRLIGGSTVDRSAGGVTGAGTAPSGGGWSDDDERAHELDLARFEQNRTTDLIRRQQQYEDRSWTPPAQGGTKRSGAEEGEGPVGGS